MRSLRFWLSTLIAVVLAPAFARAAVRVDVDLATQSMTVSEDGNALYTWPVSSGAIGRGTPPGRYRPYMLDRAHRSSLYQSAPMPYAVFFHGNYAIHGTNVISRLGHAASHGCVRLHPTNAATLFALVQKHGMANVAITIGYHLAPVAPAPVAAAVAPTAAIAAPSAPVAGMLAATAAWQPQTAATTPNFDLFAAFH